MTAGQVFRGELRLMTSQPRRGSWIKDSGAKDHHKLYEADAL